MRESKSINSGRFHVFLHEILWIVKNPKEWSKNQTYQGLWYNLQNRSLWDTTQSPPPPHGQISLNPIWTTKSDILDEMVPQEISEDPELCPVTLWATVIWCLSSYPNYNPIWPVYTFYDRLRLSCLTHTEYIIDTRAIVDTIGQQVVACDLEVHKLHNISPNSHWRSLPWTPNQIPMCISHHRKQHSKRPQAWYNCPRMLIHTSRQSEYPLLIQLHGYWRRRTFLSS